MTYTISTVHIVFEEEMNKPIETYDYEFSDEEKKQFLRPNPEYKKKPLFPIAAAF